MSAHPTAAEPSPSAEGREASGRFAPGNKGGPGNPFARKVAALRAAFVEAITEQDVREMTYLIVFNAKSGSLEWLKFLFRYAIGTPQPAVNPDTLDAQEFRALQEAAVSADAVEKVCKAAPLGVTLEVCRQAQAARDAELRAAIPELAAAPQPATATDERPRKREPRCERAARSPSTDGGYGNFADPWADRMPSTNGGDGEGALETFIEWLRDRRAAREGHSRS
jgi:hypothetical protein